MQPAPFPPRLGIALHAPQSSEPGQTLAAAFLGEGRGRLVSGAAEAPTGWEIEVLRSGEDWLLRATPNTAVPAAVLTAEWAAPAWS